MSKFIETESRMKVTRGRGRGNRSYFLIDFVSGDRKVLEINSGNGYITL